MTIQCYYDVLGVTRDADAATVKKNHRKMALKYHPDKNIGNDSAAEQFLLVQQAYECLSDPQERKWYDDHREAILAGWSTNAAPGENDIDMLFDVVPFMHPGCYSGYHSGKGGFYDVYQTVFESIVQCERRQTETTVDLPTDIGTEDSDWSHIQSFYRTWESFASALNFAWEDKYNVHEDAPNRRVRRLMEDENKKARRAAKKMYNQDILALTAFVKRRDPRVKAKQAELEQQKLGQRLKQQEQAAERKKEQQRAKVAWREEAQRAMEETEEADRLAGRVRLADLEDDYDYGGKKRGKGKKKKSKRRSTQQEDEEEDIQTTVADNENEKGSPANTDVDANGVVNDDEAGPEIVTEQDGIQPIGALESQPLEDEIFSDEEEYSESEEEPEIWRCECCRKDFKSEGQMNNHVKSKKHKEQFKKYQAKLKKREEEEIMAQIMDNISVEG